MKHSKIASVVGVIIAIAGVVSLPEFANIVPAKYGAIAALIGACVAAAGKALGATEYE